MVPFADALGKRLGSRTHYLGLDSFARSLNEGDKYTVRELLQRGRVPGAAGALLIKSEAELIAAALSHSPKICSPATSSPA